MVKVNFGDHLESFVHFVKGEVVKFFLRVSSMVQVVQKHFPHLVNRDGGIDGAGQPQPSHSVRQAPDVQRVWVRQKHGVDLVRKALQFPVK